jgi:hypothetical protein
MYIQPFHLLLTAMASWLTREQAEVIAYLKEENRVLREHITGKRIRFTDTERRRLVVKAKALGRSRLREMCPLVTPDTLLRWHRQLVARKYVETRNRRVGRPPVRAVIKELAVGMAKGNSTWGYTRKPGHCGPWAASWPELRPHPEEAWCRTGPEAWDIMGNVSTSSLGCNCRGRFIYRGGVWVKRTRVRCHVLFAMELATRRVKVLGT